MNISNQWTPEDRLRYIRQVSASARLHGDDHQRRDALELIWQLTHLDSAELQARRRHLVALYWGRYQPR